MKENCGVGWVERALRRGRTPVYTRRAFTSSCALPTLDQAEFCPLGSLMDAGSGTISQGSHKNYKTTQPMLSASHFLELLSGVYGPLFLLTPACDAGQDSDRGQGGWHPFCFTGRESEVQEGTNGG